MKYSYLSYKAFSLTLGTFYKVIMAMKIKLSLTVIKFGNLTHKCYNHIENSNLKQEKAYSFTLIAFIQNMRKIKSFVFTKRLVQARQIGTHWEQIEHLEILFF